MHHPQFIAGPWSRSDRVQVIAATSIAWLVLGSAWLGSATKADVEAQVGFGILGVGAVMFLYTATIWWLIAGRRAIGLRRRHLLGTGEKPRATTSSDCSASNALIAIDGLHRYHRPSCPMVSGGRGGSAAPREEHEGSGRTPCGICRP